MQGQTAPAQAALRTAGVPSSPSRIPAYCHTDGDETDDRLQAVVQPGHATGGVAQRDGDGEGEQRHAEHRTDTEQGDIEQSEQRGLYGLNRQQYQGRRSRHAVHQTDKQGP